MKETHLAIFDVKLIQLRFETENKETENKWQFSFMIRDGSLEK